LSTSANDQPGSLNPEDGSYIISALIKTGEPAKIRLAKNLLDNFLYENEKYGYPISTNRGWALTRSQNNVIVTNIWEYFEATKNYSWLEKTGTPNAQKIIKYWNTRIGVVKLNGDEGDDEEAGKIVEGHRWIAHGVGPREEVWDNEKNPNPYYFNILYKLAKLALTPDPKRTEYAKSFDYNRVVDVANETDLENWKKENSLKAVKVKDIDLGTAKAYILSGKWSGSKKDEPVIELDGIFYTLTPKYFSNDRAAVTSGFSPSDIYGPFGAFVDEFIDTAHNIQLYRANMDLAKMYDVLAKRFDKIDKNKAKTFRENVELYTSEAKEDKAMIMEFLKNKDSDMFFNYNYHLHKERTIYPVASGAYAIWGSLFDITKPDEIKMLMKIADYMSQTLEGPNGYYASGVNTGLLWDKPNVSAVQQGMIIDGLRRYAKLLAEKGKMAESKKLTEVADRVALKYLGFMLEKGKTIKKTAIIAAIFDLYSGLSDPKLLER
jgi:hypothetical protein